MSTIARLTIDEYDRMIKRDVFDQDRRIELIRGQLREMNPIGPTHEDVVDILSEWSITHVPLEKVRVRIQNSIGIPSLDTVPEPDVVWVARKSYARGRPTNKEIFLVIEVADSSLDYDRGEKADLYATAGIKDYWVVNVPEQTVEIFRTPRKGHYQESREYASGKTVRPLAFSKLALPVSLPFTHPH